MCRKHDIYRNALTNILKLGGKCWDGNRECSDPEHVAREALKKADPKFYESIDNVNYRLFKVNKKTGKVTYAK